MYKTSRGNTSTLWRHANKNHKRLLNETRNRATSAQPTLFEVVEKKSDTYRDDSSRKKELDAALVKMVAQDLQPLSIVEDKGFKDFCSKMDKKYRVPSRKHLRNVLLHEAFNKTQSDLKSKLSQTEAVCVTTDLWTSATNTSFLALTCHFWDEKEERLSSAILDCASVHGRHTADMIREEIDKVLDCFSIKHKVLAVVTDNGSNIKKAIEDMGLRRLSCYAHCINLVVMDAIKSIPQLQAIREKVSRIVKLTRQSTVAKEMLDRIQVDLGKKPKRLIQDVVTRWNSLYQMLERCLELRDAISLLLTKPGMDKDMTPLGSAEWGMIEDAVSLLQPCFEATVELSGEKISTGSKAIPMTRVLMAHYAGGEREALQGSFSQQLAHELLKNLHSRFEVFEDVRILTMATLVDPRFKNCCFRLQDKKRHAIAQLSKELKENHLKANQMTTTPAGDPPPKKVKSIWDKYDSGIMFSILNKYLPVFCNLTLQTFFSTFLPTLVDHFS